MTGSQCFCHSTRDHVLRFNATLSGCVYVPKHRDCRGSHILTDESQLPVKIAFTSGAYSMARIASSWVPRVDSERKQNRKSEITQKKFSDKDENTKKSRLLRSI